MYLQIYGQQNDAALSLVSGTIDTGYEEYESVLLLPDDRSVGDTGMFLDPTTGISISIFD